MDDTAVEDFQDYHNHQRAGDVDEALESSPQAHDHIIGNTQYDLDDDDASFSGSACHSSGLEEAVFDRSTRASSPRTSSGSEGEISVLESHYDLAIHTPSPFKPLQTRSPFRHPSSVRAIQMDTTPPHLASSSSQHRPKLYTPSRQGTPRSIRSHRSTMSVPSKLSPTKKVKKEYPLVLLHVTLLPIPLHYSQEILESVLPPSILENWKLLQEKATNTVLERGILIPHPKEDYDLLEERLLESLELKMPRILKCGHFHLSPEEEADVLAESDDDEGLDDADICVDCGRRIRDGQFGSGGTGSKRWDIKLFAANGLMRAGAWSAAWREMERVDVEILPWMEEDMKRELELRREEEEKARMQAREEGVGGLDDERIREIYGGDAQAYVDGLADERMRMPSTPRQVSQKEARMGHEDVPLWDLFRNYVYDKIQDHRNMAIFVLSIVVLFLGMGTSISRNRPSIALEQPIHNIKSMPEPSVIATEILLQASVPTPVTNVEESPSISHSSESQHEAKEEQGASWVDSAEAAEEVLGEMIED
ncbi:hypothetical protein MMC21_004897 [Puttea exsequens]|nr:hypothetical protein [Puttea exsequens]